MFKKINIIGLFVLLFTLLSSNVAFAEKMPIAEILKQYENSVVRVEVSRLDKELSTPGMPIHAIGQGTAFFIDSMTLITNYHVVRDSPDSIKIFRRPIQKYGNPVSVVYIDKLNDIAILKVNYANAVKGKPLTFASPEDNSNIFTIGYPYAEYSYSEGTLNLKLDSKEVFYEVDGVKVQLIPLHIKIDSGNSGGPILNESGEVVGIATFTSTKISGLAFSMKYEAIIKAVSDYREDEGVAA